MRKMPLASWIAALTVGVPTPLLAATAVASGCVSRQALALGLPFAPHQPPPGTPQARDDSEDLLKLLGDGDPDVVNEALLRIKRDPTGYSALALQLVGLACKQLPRDEDRIALHAGEAIARFGPDGVTALVGVLATGSNAAREWAVRPLGGTSAPVAKQVAPLLRSPKPVRCYALAVLAQRGPESADVLDDVLPWVDNEDGEVRLVALGVVGAIGREAARAVPRLVALLTHEDTYTRSSAAAALGGIGEAGRDALPALKEMLHSPHEHLAASGAFAIVRVDPQSLPVVLDVLRPGSRQAPAIVRGLGNAYAKADVVPPELVDLLCKGVVHQSMLVRIASADAINAIGHAAAASIPTLLEQLDRERESAVQVRLIAALAHVGGAEPNVRLRLTEAAGQEVTAIDALRGLLTPTEFARAVKPALASASMWMRHAAVVELGKSPPTAEGVELLAAAAKDREATVRAAAAFSLSSSAEFAETRVAALIPLLDDAEEEVRMYAIRGLGRMGPGAAAAEEKLKAIKVASGGKERVWAERALRRITSR